MGWFWVYRAEGLGLRALGLGFRVEGFGLRGLGFRFRVSAGVCNSMTLEPRSLKPLNPNAS